MRINPKVPLHSRRPLIYCWQMKKVHCYFNLHKKCLSVRFKGLVINHTEEIELDDVTFHVSQAGRERVIREKRKNVHATVRGHMVADKLASRAAVEAIENAVAVTYNPYLYNSFVKVIDKTPISQAKKVFIFGRKILAII